MVQAQQRAPLQVPSMLSSAFISEGGVGLQWSRLASGPTSPLTYYQLRRGQGPPFIFLKEQESPPLSAISCDAIQYWSIGHLTQD